MRCGQKSGAFEFKLVDSVFQGYTGQDKVQVSYAVQEIYLQIFQRCLHVNKNII